MSDEKGFGFIVSDDGDEKVFFHISSVKASTRRPLIGDCVVYDSKLDAKNRLQSIVVAIEGIVSPLGAPRKSQFIRVVPPRTNTFDYLLIFVLLGCLGKAGLIYYQTRQIDDTVAPYSILR